MDLLHELLFELDTVARVEPTDELEEGDVVIGILPEDVHPLYWLFAKYEAADDDLLDRTDKHHEKEPHDKEECKALERETYFLALRNAAVHELFWNSVMSAFPDEFRHQDRIGLCKDWKVIKRPKQNVLGCLQPW